MNKSVELLSDLVYDEPALQHKPQHHKKKKKKHDNEENNKTGKLPDNGTVPTTSTQRADETVSLFADNPRKRRTFLMQVYTVVLSQMMVIFVIECIFLLTHPIISENTILGIVLGCSILSAIVMISFCFYPRPLARTLPTNILLLTLFTIFISISRAIVTDYLLILGTVMVMACSIFVVTLSLSDWYDYSELPCILNMMGFAILLSCFFCWAIGIGSFWKKLLSCAWGIGLFLFWSLDTRMIVTRGRSLIFGNNRIHERIPINENDAVYGTILIFMDVTIIYWGLFYGIEVFPFMAIFL